MNDSGWLAIFHSGAIAIYDAANGAKLEERILCTDANPYTGGIHFVDERTLVVACKGELGLFAVPSLRGRGRRSLAWLGEIGGISWGRQKGVVYGSKAGKNRKNAFVFDYQSWTSTGEIALTEYVETLVIGANDEYVVWSSGDSVYVSGIDSIYNRIVETNVGPNPRIFLLADDRIIVHGSSESELLDLDTGEALHWRGTKALDVASTRAGVLWMSATHLGVADMAERKFVWRGPDPESETLTQYTSGAIAVSEQANAVCAIRSGGAGNQLSCWPLGPGPIESAPYPMEDAAVDLWPQGLITRTEGNAVWVTFEEEQPRMTVGAKADLYVTFTSELNMLSLVLMYQGQTGALDFSPKDISGSEAYEGRDPVVRAKVGDSVGRSVMFEIVERNGGLGQAGEHLVDLLQFGTTVRVQMRTWKGDD